MFNESEVNSAHDSKSNFSQILYIPITNTAVLGKIDDSFILHDLLYTTMKADPNAVCLVKNISELQIAEEK